ncbi:MAG: hypothetical protein ABSD96_10035 [Candidatus Korobacteraceae bacterium]
MHCPLGGIAPVGRGGGTGQQAGLVPTIRHEGADVVYLDVAYPPLVVSAISDDRKQLA